MRRQGGGADCRATGQFLGVRRRVGVLVCARQVRSVHEDGLRGGAAHLSEQVWLLFDGTRRTPVGSSEFTGLLLLECASVAAPTDPVFLRSMDNGTAGSGGRGAICGCATRRADHTSKRQVIIKVGGRAMMVLLGWGSGPSS